MLPLPNQPIPYNLFLKDRRFEEFTNDIYKQDINAGEFGNQFDDITLLNGTHEQGRDCVLHKNGHNVGVVQCKLLSISLTKPTSVKEIIKFCLYSILHPEFIHDRSTFEYHFVCPNGFNNTTILFLKDFKNQVLKEVKLDEWIKDVIKKNSSLQLINLDNSKEQLYDILSSITVKPIIGNDLDLKFSKAHNQNLHNKYFKSETVVDNTALIPISEKLEVLLERSKKTSDKQTVDDYNHFITKISPNQYYIPRKVQNALENNETTAKNLVSLIEENKKTNIVVLASAGMGKTEELKQTAITLANRELKYPIFVSFSNFTVGKDIEYYLPDTWENVPQEQLVLLFDGFDELIDNQINDIQRKLISFVENHPKIIIVVSCRTNFYHLAINGNPETLSGFNAYYLQQLTYADVVNHVTNKHDLNGQSFMNAVYHRQFDDLVYNPFFLQILIPDFKQNNAFSGNRTQLFQKFIKERLSWDKEHFATSFNLNDEESKALELLRKVSIAMEMLGSRNISIKDLRTLISDKPDFELIKHCTVFNKEEGFEHWKFEHNNFQEILCAEMLANLPFKTVIELISFKRHNKIQPSWTNTVSFLISLLNEDDTLFQPLVDWIISNDPEILIRFEKEKIPQKLRNEIFIRIFEYYKELNIWIKSNKFSHLDLAHFAQSNDTIDFLAHEISNNQNARRVRLNGIFILLDMSFGEYPDKENIKSILITLLRTEELDSSSIFYIITLIERIGFVDQITVDELLSIVGENNSSYVRAAFYGIMNEGNLYDTYIDYYLEGLKMRSNRYSQIPNRDKTNLLSENTMLFTGIGNFNTIKTLTSFIDCYLQNYDHIDDKYDFKAIYKRIINNFIELYFTNKSIYESVLRLFKYQTDYWRSDKASQTLVFFVKTETLSKACNDILKEITQQKVINYPLIHSLTELINESYFTNVFVAYNSGLISEEVVKSIFNNLERKDKELSLKFLEDIHIQTNIKIEIPECIDYNALNKKKKQESFNLLFDTESFKNECLRVFEDNESLSKDQLWIYSRNGNIELEDIYTESALSLLRDFVDDEKNIKKDFIINWFEKNPNVSNYIIYEIYNNLKNDDGKLCISALQIEYIKKWFNKNIKTIDFINALEKGEDASYTINWHALFCVYFMEKFDFECPENIHLDMLAFTFNAGYVSFESITKKIDKKKVESRIISNIKDGVIKNDSVYENHAEYIFENNIYEAFSYVFKDLCSSTFDQYYRSSIIDLFFKHQANTKPLKLFLDKLNFETQTVVLKWLVKNGDLNYSVRELIRLHENNLNESDEKIINNLLISCKSIIGLEFSIQWIKKYMQSPFSQHGQTLVYFDTLDSLPYFIELLELSYNKEIKIGNQLDGMLSLVLDGIYNLAIQSQINFKEVCSKLKEFIEVNKGKLEEVEFLNATIERIKEKFFQTHSEKYSIHEIKTKIALF